MERKTKIKKGRVEGFLNLRKFGIKRGKMAGAEFFLEGGVKREGEEQTEVEKEGCGWHQKSANEQGGEVPLYCKKSHPGRGVGRRERKPGLCKPEPRGGGLWWGGQKKQ